MLGMTDHGFGLFAGTAVNDTSSVTAAASAWDGIHGSNTLEIATIVKLTRTLAIIPITLVLALWRTHKAKTEQSKGGEAFSLKRAFPMFILYFVLASIITTVCTTVGVPAGVFTPLKTLSKFFIVMAMAAIGMNTNIVKLVKTGGKPIFMGLLLLGRYRVRQHRDAALARVPLSEKEKHKGLMSFVLFAFLLLFECIKPFGHRPVCAHGSGACAPACSAPAGAAAPAAIWCRCRLARSAVRLPAAPVWDCGVQALRQSQQPD